MSDNTTVASSTAMRRSIDSYQQNGYTVLVEPPSEDLPEFLSGYRPDFIAFAPGGLGGVIGEVSTGSPRKARLIAVLAARLAEYPNWKLDVVGAPPVDEEADDAESTQDLDDQLAEAKVLIASSRSRAGYLLLWSAIEGALRAFIEKKKLGGISRNALDMYKTLISAGFVDEIDYSRFRRAFDLRSRWTHGLRTPSVDTSAAISDSIEIADRLVNQVKSAS